MSCTRRELLGGLGAASASAVLWALGGCRAAPTATIAERHEAGDVAAWLRAAIEQIATAFPAQADTAHALAVVHTRAAAAVDVLGRGVSRGRREGVVLRVHGPDGVWREEVSGDLSQEGVARAATALVGAVRAAGPARAFGPPAPLALPTTAAGGALRDADLLDRVDAMGRADVAISSRIVYAANALELDDVALWSVALGRQRAARTLRVRRLVTRVAWTGTRPVISERALGWRGGLDDHAFTAEEIQGVSEGALALMSPGELVDGDYELELAPSVVATVMDAAARELFTSAAGRRPEVAARLTAGAAAASPLLTLVDDPAAEGAYGGVPFDDDGIDAAPVALLTAGRVTGQLSDAPGGGRARRPGHTGPRQAAPTHLRLAPGVTRGRLVATGLALHGARGCVIDPSSDRVVIGARRADQIAGGEATGRAWADVEVVGSLGALLAAVSAVSAEPRVVPLRDDVDGLPRWRSIEAPALVTHGRVRARRRAT